MSEGPGGAGRARVVVVGSGIAGLVAALHAADTGCDVTLVTKDVLEHANTRYAQGGIAGVMFDDDSAAAHERDTLAAGAGLCDPDAVRVLVAEGPARIRELIDLGVAFDRAADGAFVKGLEAAHSYPRVLHAGGDATGSVIEKALVARIRTSGVRVLEHAFLRDLVHDGDTPPRVTGVDLLIAEGAAPPRAERLDADAVVLATGGAGQLYAHTTNPPVATGDGIAAALRAGAEVIDLEFVQFHPTVLPGTSAAGGRAGAAGAADTVGAGVGAGDGDGDAHGVAVTVDARRDVGGDAADPFLVSEAVRGEGAVLRDEEGRRFLLDVHPDAELAPRDVVARAIADVMDTQGGRPVLLDATALGPAGSAKRTASFLARRFPTIDAAVRARGWDWAREPIPVTPAAHYLMGGVATDRHGRTSIRGLYAVGEVARTGVHGANRLASNSLLEGAVFGARAGDVVASDIRSGTWPAAPEPAGTAPDTSPGAAPASPADAPPFSRAALQELMWRDAGLVRDEDGLARAAATLAAWRDAARPARPDVAACEDENLREVATAVVAAARARPASVGAHARRDAASGPAPVVAGVASEVAGAADAPVAAAPSTDPATAIGRPSVPPLLEVSR